MKSKSYVIDTGYFKTAKRGFIYGEIMAESYWKEDKNGVYHESSPNTSEILNYWFYNAPARLNGDKITVYEYDTGLILDVYKSPDGVTTERIIFKPSNAFDESAFNSALKKIYDNYINSLKHC